MDQLSFLSKKREILIDSDGRAIVYPQVIEEHQRLMDELIQELPWRQDYITMYGKTHPIPRLQLWMADNGLSYTYSGIEMQPIEFHPVVLKIKELTEQKAKIKFNSCLINYYRDGNDYVAWHADDEKGLGPTIASVSLGQQRSFKFKHRSLPLKKAVDLQGGDIVVMEKPLQEFWLHQISKTKKEVGPRVNLTFRTMSRP